MCRGEDGRQEAGKREQKPVYDPVVSGKKGRGQKTGKRERESIYDPMVSGE